MTTPSVTIDAAAQIDVDYFGDNDARLVFDFADGSPSGTVDLSDRQYRLRVYAAPKFALDGATIAVGALDVGSTNLAGGHVVLTLAKSLFTVVPVIAYYEVEQAVGTGPYSVIAYGLLRRTRGQRA